MGGKFLSPEGHVQGLTCLIMKTQSVTGEAVWLFSLLPRVPGKRDPNCPGPWVSEVFIVSVR